MIAQMTSRGISAAKARALLAGTDPDLVLDQLEWGDRLVASQPGRFTNPPGFYIHLISEKVPPPEDFETSRKRKAREEARAAEGKAQLRRLELEDAYRNYRAAAIDRHLVANGKAEDFEALVAEELHKAKRWLKNLPPETLRQIAERNARTVIAKRLSIPTIEEFGHTYRGGEGEAADDPVRTA